MPREPGVFERSCDSLPFQRRWSVLASQRCPCERFVA